MLQGAKICNLGAAIWQAILNIIFFAYQGVCLNTAITFTKNYWNSTCAFKWYYQKCKLASLYWPHFSWATLYIFATKARIDNWKKNLLNSNISLTCPYNMVTFGLIAAEIVSLVWGTPANFNGFHVLAELLHSTLVAGVSQTLRRWTEGATYIRQGGHHVGHLPTL